MEYDPFGLPRPVDFEDSSRPARPRVTAGRIALLLGVLAAGASAAAIAHWGPEVLADLPRQFAMRHRNAPRAIVARLNSHLEQGNYPKALVEIDRLLRIAPDNLELRIVRAEIYVRMKQFPKAIQEYTMLLEIDPLNATALNNRAYNRALAKIDLEEAQADIERAIDIAGEVPVFVDTRAYLNYLMGKPREALEDFDRILNDPLALADLGGPQLGEIYFHRGLAHRELGNGNAAADDFNKARQLGFQWDEMPAPLRRAEAKPAGPHAVPVKRRAETLRPSTV